MANSKILDLCGEMTPRASISIIPKVERSPKENKLLKTYTEKSIKRNQADGN